METFIQDLRYGVRTLIKRPSFALIVVLALAVGIGVNTAIFSVVNAVLIRRLPYQSPDQLTMVWGHYEELQLSSLEIPASAANFVDWREQNQSFTEMAAFRTWAYNYTGGDRPDRIWAARVSHNLFSLLGVNPEIGRAFRPEEEKPGNDKVVLISHGLWQRRFGSEQEIVGRQLMLSDESFTVIGVMPPGFNFPNAEGMPAGFRFANQTDIWTPLAMTEADLANRGTQNMAVVGRLKSDVNIGQAQAEMSTIAKHLEEQYPNTNSGYGVTLVPLQDQIVGSIKPALLILLGAVGFVLLIACANVANLLLARAATRQKEIAVRMALGANRMRLIRQLLTESTLLALIGGTLGTLLALWGVDVLLSLVPEGMPRVGQARIDGLVLGFTLAVSLVTGVLFGLAPALQLTKRNLHETLKEGGRSSSEGARGGRLRGALVVSEVALSLVLLIAAGLLIKSFIRLQSVNPGFKIENVLTFDMLLPFGPKSRYAEGDKQAAFFQQITERIEGLGGVEAAGAVSSLPLSGAVESTGFRIDGRQVDPLDPGPEADYAFVTPHYFRALSIPLIRGREFTNHDAQDAQPAVIINDALARTYFPGEDPLGKHIAIFGPAPCEIVGIVGDIKQSGLNARSRPAMYMPAAQGPSPLMTLVIHTASDPQRFIGAVREEIWAADKDQPVSEIKTMEQLLAASLSERRFHMLLLAIFAGVAMALAGVGIYGMISYSVTQRTHEIGVRMALGATSRAVRVMIVAQGLRLTLSGIAVGLAASLALTRLMTSLLYGVSATDASTFVIISALLAGIALAASYVPARRATRVDPMMALRYE